MFREESVNRINLRCPPRLINNKNTYSQTSKTTCCNRSGNFCTIVTGCPDVRDTPYMGAVVLYRVLHRRAGVLLHSDEPIDRPTKQQKLIA